MRSKLSCVARLVRQNARGFTTSEKRCITQEEVQKIKKKQEFFQKQHPHVPVHMITRKVHFYITTALGVLVLISTGQSMYRILTH